jgi:hypothetical protein
MRISVEVELPEVEGFEMGMADDLVDVTADAIRFS